MCSTVPLNVRADCEAAQPKNPIVRDRCITPKPAPHSPREQELLELANNPAPMLRYLLAAGAGPEEAEDAFQEMMAHLWPAISQGRHQIKTSVLQLAKATALNKFRQMRRPKFTRKMRAASSDQALAGVTSPERDPVGVATSAEIAVLVAGEINDLDAKCKEVVRLKDIEELSAKEVAARTGLTQEAVKYRLAKARRQLRRRLGGLDVFD